MIEITINFFYWEFFTSTNFATDIHHVVGFSLMLTSITDNLFILFYCSNSIATLMKTCAANIAIDNFIFRFITGWKTYLTIGFKKFIVLSCCTFWFVCIKKFLIVFHAINCSIIITQSFINVTLSKIQKGLILRQSCFDLMYPFINVLYLFVLLGFLKDL